MIAVRRLAVLLVVAACAKPTAGSTGTAGTTASSGSGAASASRDGAVITDAGPAVRKKKSSTVISREELDSPVVAGLDALRAIRQLRPTFFRTTAPTSWNDDSAGSNTRASLDFGPLMSINDLSSMDTHNVYEVLYLSPSDAATRFGLNANAGPVIVLVTNKSTPK